jgi:asparagine synthase (glutamine-hydrolysing)
MARLAVVVDWEGRDNLFATLSKLMMRNEHAADDHEFYIDNQAAFGQQRQLLISVDKQFILASDARLDNRDELLDMLRGETGITDIISDAALILTAFHKWGAACPEKLVGDFAFIIWDAQNRRLFAACDGMNMRSISYMRMGSELSLASEGEQLLQHPKITPNFCKLGLAGWISGWPDPTISMFSGVEVLPAGHLLMADARRVEIRKFWDIDPEKQIRYRQTQDYEEHLRELLRRAVSDRLRTSEATIIASQMSGGMDSTTVTALANQEVKRCGNGLFVISHSYRSSSSCDETDRILETLSHLGITNSRFIAAEDHADLNFQSLYPPTLESPGTVLSPRYADEMVLLKAAGAKVLLTGSGGDEMAWGHSLTYSQRLRHGDLRAVWEVINGCREMQLPTLRTLRQLFVNPFAPIWLKRILGRSTGAIQLPDWVPDEAIRQLDLEERLLSKSSTHFRNPALQARYEALRRTSTLNSVRSYGQVGAEYGIDVRHPFFDTRLAEFSFAIPDDLWIRKSYPKWLLRRTMDGVLPDSVCWNRHKVVFDSFFGKIIGDQAENIRNILADTQLQEIGLLDTQKLLATFDRVVSGRQGFNVELLYALMAQIWFQRYWGSNHTKPPAI